MPSQHFQDALRKIVYLRIECLDLPRLMNRFGFQRCDILAPLNSIFPHLFKFFRQIVSEVSIARLYFEMQPMNVCFPLGLDFFDFALQLLRELQWREFFVRGDDERGLNLRRLFLSEERDHSGDHEHHASNPINEVAEIFDMAAFDFSQERNE